MFVRNVKNKYRIVAIIPKEKFEKGVFIDGVKKEFFAACDDISSDSPEYWDIYLSEEFHKLLGRVRSVEREYSDSTEYEYDNWEVPDPEDYGYDNEDQFLEDGQKLWNLVFPEMQRKSEETEKILTNKKKSSEQEHKKKADEYDDKMIDWLLSCENMIVEWAKKHNLHLTFDKARTTLSRYFKFIDPEDDDKPFLSLPEEISIRISNHPPTIDKSQKYDLSLVYSSGDDSFDFDLDSDQRGKLSSSSRHKRTSDISELREFLADLEKKGEWKNTAKVNLS